VRKWIIEQDPHTVKAPVDSTFGIAVQFTQNGEPVPVSVNDAVMDGNLSAMDTIDGKYVLFKFKSGDPALEQHVVQASLGGTPREFRFWVSDADRGEIYVDENDVLTQTVVLSGTNDGNNFSMTMPALGE